MINVIFAALGRTGSCPSRVISIARLLADDFGLESKRPKVYPHLVLSFFEEDNWNHPTPQKYVGNHSSDWGLRCENGNGR